MRRLGQALHVEAMSLYKHVTGKEDILDGMADLVTGEFAVPSYDVGWRESIRLSATSAHEVLLRHPWAGALIESRSGAGPARLRYLDAVIGVLATAGFPMPTVVRAIMTLDSYVYGFTLQELAWPYDAGTAPASAEALAQALPVGEFANLRAMAGMVTSEPWTVVVDFPFGLDLILDGLERLRDA
ncbi:MAG: TetR/AcrR family transcriptional regulator C-terminal domain-containing protein [Chloroflexi bacterium]|jgi:hypothetical protein|nr:TetR/AcrR family transcriptional regulator C-terminal domain-containing protein [Chloroflexota bacterium]